MDSDDENGPIGTRFFSHKCFFSFLLLFYLSTTTPNAHEMLASAHAHPPHLQMRARGGFFIT